MEKKLLKIWEVCELLSISRSQVYKLIQHGDLQSLKIGASRRVPNSAIDLYLGGLAENDEEGRLSA